ncbi:metal-dependent hydrolase [Halalkalicoccus sp. NIPERK01]|uniref:metal-dependent hydrolase n=1 Tax=Halalkalicoccus sp. NIPERK01 TaxID=3053469 RepID=UPI00256F6196|nr:metal-dependent hydrolase [Halalkalicoccus sp. NIPERK01]MDL5362180.1 metal-dependent hydrolase [Halalkalicoccus sp. NIPERK01]
MWPWEHAALAYVLYSALTRRRGRSPGDVATLWVLVASQLPDLIDKPLAWTFGVVHSGRMLAHAPVVAVPLCVLVYWYFSRRSTPEYGVAFGVGYLSHVAGDAVGSALVGEYAYARFLLWPLVSVPVDDQESVLGEVVDGLSPSPWLLVSGLVGVAVVGLWIADGKPGLGTFRRERSGSWRRDG